MSEALAPAVTRPPVARTGSAGMALPAVIVDAGPAAVERFLEFFAASIANGRTRAAYGRAVGQFLSWCAARGLGLRLARRPPGAAGESGRGGAGTEARGDQRGDAGADAGRGGRRATAAGAVRGGGVPRCCAVGLDDRARRLSMSVAGSRKPGGPAAPGLQQHRSVEPTLTGFNHCAKLS